MSTSSSAVFQNNSNASFHRRSLWRAYLVWGLATLFYFYDNLLQISPSAMKPELSLAFTTGAEQFGSLSAYCLYAYGLMQIPAGLLMDRFGPKRLLTFAALCCAGGSLLFGVATTLWEAKFGRLIIGVGASFAVVGCLKIAGHWFSANRFAFITGLTISVGLLGAVFGLSGVSKVVQVLGWRETMQWGGWLGLLLGVVLWFVIKDKVDADSEELLAQEPELVQTGMEVLIGLTKVLKHKQTWLAALYAGLMYVPTLAFGGLWGIPFLVEAYGFDRTVAGACISLIYVGWVFGAPFWGFVSDHFRRRNWPMMVATLTTLANCLAVLYLQGLSFFALSSLLFTLGFFSSGFILAFAVVRESNAPQTAGTAIGFTNALNTLWGAIAQPLIGKILDLSHAGLSPLEDGAERVFTLNQYQDALITLPISIGIAFFLLFFVKETFCQVKER